MDENKKISIIVPIYNSEKYLDECLLSIQNQSYTNFEVLLINDGSTDNSNFICEKFVSQDVRFRHFSQENKGVSSARNYGLKEASGEFITFIDSDDYVEANHLEELYRTLVQSDAQISVTSYKMKHKDGRMFLNTYTKRMKRIIGFSSIYRDEFLEIFPQFFWVNQSFHCAVSKLFSKKVVDGLFFDESLFYAEDLDFYFRLYLRVKKVAFSNILSYVYRLHDENVTRNQNELLIKNELDVHKNIIEEIQKMSIPTIHYYNNFNSLLKVKMSMFNNLEIFKPYLNFLELLKEEVTYPSELISVVVLVSNSSPYLRLCLDRLEQQSYKNFEVIIIDDNSSDDSREICQEYIKRDSRFKYVFKNEKVINSSKNIGLMQCEGEYITFINGTDFVDINYLKNLYYASKRNDSEVVISGYMVFDQLENIYRIHELENEEIQYNELELFKTLFNSEYENLTFNSSWGILFSRRLTDNYKFPISNSVEDIWTNYLLFIEAERSTYIRENLYVLRTGITLPKNGMSEEYLRTELISVLKNYTILSTLDINKETLNTRLLKKLKTLYDFGNKSQYNNFVLNDCLELINIFEKLFV